MPDNPTALSFDACERCSAGAPEIGWPLARVYSGYAQSLWCLGCIERQSFVCSACEHLTTTSERKVTPNNEIYCASCFWEYYNECNGCGITISKDDTWDAGEDLYCMRCFNQEFFHCQICEHAYRKEDYDYYPLSHRYHADVRVCQDCLDVNPANFALCPQTDNRIYIPWHDTWMIHNGLYTERRWCEQNLEPSALNRALEESELQQRRNSTAATIRNTRNGGGIKQLAKNQSIGQLTSNLLNKVKENLSSAVAPGISPVHNRIYIGMEIEAVDGKFISYTASKAPKKQGIQMGPHLLLNRLLPKGTKMVRDGSIQGNNGQEFLPPVVKNKADWKKIERAVKALKELEWKANESCGLHMHFSHADINPENPKLTKDIFKIFYYLEPMIFNCLPIERRNNEYCKPISAYFSKEDIKQDVKLDYWYYGNFWKKRIRRNNDHNAHPSYVSDAREGELRHVNFGDGKINKTNIKIMKEQDHYFVGRYIGCNLHALYQKGTIELRYFPSILEFGYIYAWAKLMENVFAYALKGGTSEPIENAMAAKMKSEDKIKAIGKIFGWKEALVKFLITELKTHLNAKPNDRDILTGQYRQTTPEQEERLNQRIRHSTPGILEAEPIPNLHPLAENPPTPAPTASRPPLREASVWTEGYQSHDPFRSLSQIPDHGIPPIRIEDEWQITEATITEIPEPEEDELETINEELMRDLVEGATPSSTTSEAPHA